MSDPVLSQLMEAANLHERGAIGEAIEAYRKAIALNPNLPEAQYNLGHLLVETGQLPAGVECFATAVRLRPNFSAAHFNLGTTLRALGRLDDAAQALITAAEQRPDHAGTWNNLANTLHDLGKVDRAMMCYRQALAIDPGNQRAHDNLLLLSYYDPAQTPAAILNAHRAWGLKFADPLTAGAPHHANDRTPDRVLRVGYVSPRFCESAEFFFLAPLFESHDPKYVQIYCYSDSPREDAFTERLRSRSAMWRTTATLNDEALASQIRDDRIDILVDLMGHGSSNRLLTFARKPAPVQVTYLCYPGTMGLSAIDYRFSDPFLDPPGRHDGEYAEKTIRLPGCYWCYQPWDAAPPVGPLPAQMNGYITFGCLNRFDKITPQCLAIWSQVLAAVPKSRLLLYAEEGSGRGGVVKALGERGVESDRILFVPGQSLADYLGTFSRIDIALDTFPCCGATTTCHSLWMGVPVVSLIGPTVMGRSGLSILSTIGRSDLVADSPEHYAQIAAQLATDLAALAAQRSDMRARMTTSPLMDAHAFARGVEQAYRRMWERWCQGSREAASV